MWTEEDEEKYKDMAFVEIMTRGKRSVMGKLPDKFYVREKLMPFQYCKLFGETLGVFLPEKEGDVPHIGSGLYYPEDMGEYVECVSEDNKYFITVEYFAHQDIPELEPYTQAICDELSQKYEELKISMIKHYVQKEWEMAVAFLKVSGEIDYCGMLFIGMKENHMFRCWLVSGVAEYETVINMAYEMVENINWYK